MGIHFSCGRPREPPEPTHPTQTTYYTQTGGGIYNPQIQGVNIADGGGNINMGPVISGGSTFTID